jgi:hypothetical protein
LLKKIGRVDPYPAEVPLGLFTEAAFVMPPVVEPMLLFVYERKASGYDHNLLRLLTFI